MKPLVAVCCLLLVLAPAACGDEDGAASGGSVEAGTADGILTVVTGDELVLRTFDGDEITFALRPADARQLDLLHLQLHARDRLPSRVHYEAEGSTWYATRVDDL